VASWLGWRSEQFCDVEFGLGDSVAAMVFALRGDMNPLVDDDVRDADGHEMIAGFVTTAEALCAEHLADARALDMNEWLDVSVVRFNPSQRADYVQWAMGVEDFGAVGQTGYAVSM
jgi:hypothetical protein